jgi:signal transduction histidine kinase
VSVDLEAGWARLAGPLRRHPFAGDALLVALLVLLGAGPSVAEHRGSTHLIFTVAMALPLLGRRRDPVRVFAALAAVAFVQWALDVRAFGDIALLVGLYTVAVTQPAVTTLKAAAVLEAGIVLATVRWGAPDALRIFIGLNGLATAAAVLGTSARHRRALLASLEERAARLELERDQQGRLAAAAERSHIAREMHDIVAHNLTVMIALADGASYALHDDPARAELAMATASRTGRQALTEMRRLLGVLRDDVAGTGARELAPQPGIEQLDALLEQVRAAGVPVNSDRSGPPLADLPEGLQLALFRIVQEALTNTLKHAGPGVSARVSVVRGHEALEVEVTDTGTAPPAPAADGRGLRGMRERAAVYDGVLEAGPLPEGGWRVALRVPLAQPAPVGAPA